MNLTNFIERDTFLVVGFLVLIAISALLSKRSGIINIALEGQFISGGLGYTLIWFWLKQTTLNKNFIYLLALLGAVIWTMLISLIFAFFVINIKMNQILTGLAINVIIGGLTMIIITSLVDKPELSGNSDYLKTYNEDSMKKYHYLIIEYKSKQIIPINYGFFCVLIITIGIRIFLFQTRHGLRIRACGENSDITSKRGISVKKYRYMAILMGGILIGLASSFFAEWKTGFNGSGSGYGYFGLIIMFLSRNKIWRIWFFSILFTISQTLVFTTINNEFRSLILAVTYAVPLIILFFYGIWTKKLKTIYWNYKI